jgi:hypothetical protein
MWAHQEHPSRAGLRIAATVLVLAACAAGSARAVAPPARALPDQAPTDLERLVLPVPAVVGGAANELALPVAAPQASGEASGEAGRGQRRGAPGFTIAARRHASEEALEAWVGMGAARRFEITRNARTGLPHRLIGPPVSIADGRILARVSDVETAARAWLEAHAPLWAGDEHPGAFDLALVKSHRVGATWFLVFQQRHLGAEVEGGRVDLRVRDDGALVLLGSDWLPGVDVDPRGGRIPLGVNDARARLANGFDAARDHALGGERVILPWPLADGGVAYRLVDRVRHRVEDPPALWRSYVDANTGEVLARENELRYDTLVGQVTAKVHPATPTDPLATFPLRDNVVGSSLDSVYTNASGRYALPNISAGTPIRNGLRGPYAEIVRSVPGAPVQLFNAPANDTLNFLWQFPQADSSEADAFYHVHVVRQYLRKIEPAFNALDYRVPVTVNIPSLCNAFWDGVGVNFFRWGIQGNGVACANTGMIADVIYHEYGHGRTQEVWAPLSPSGAMHEGLSDYLAATITNQPIIGRGFFGPGTSLRSTQNTQLVNAPSCAGEVHCVGNAISGSLWDLRRNLIAAGPDSATAIALADSLFHFAGYGGAPWHDDYALDLLVVDDNDGNLLNGTPHYGAIRAAFTGHGIAIPDTTSGVWIVHVPLPDAAMGAGPFQVDAKMGSFAAAFVAGSATLHWRYQNGQFHADTMTPLGGDLYRGSIPTPPGGGRVDYYLTAADAGARTGASPEDAPATVHTFYVGNLSAVFADDFETDKGWSSITSASTGRWMRVDPNGTPDPDFPDFFYQTEDDHTPSPGHFCFVTGDTTAGFDIGAADVDGGCVTLLSPRIDLSAVTNARLEYWRWFTDETRYDDTLFVEVSANDGATWSELERQPFTQNAWLQRSFDLGSRVLLTSQFRFRIRTCDVDGGSLLEAALDDFAITTRTFGAVAVEDENVPGVAFVESVRPNPAHGDASVRIAYGVPRAAPGEASAPVLLQVVDLRGRVVKTLVDGPLPPGLYSAVWDGTNTRGERTGAGVYFVRFTTIHQQASGKIVRLN